tara:strand:+ start:136 stop:324 length:189 start_codon:yes stop_codon:yes gene_type:complete
MNDSQSIGVTSLAIMTFWNMIMGCAMLGGLHVAIGMPIAFIGMVIIIFITYKLLMGNEKPWE